jgi:hypothetical protein
MSVETTFWFTRYERLPKRDDKGNITSGIIIVEAEDCINLYEVQRGWWRDDQTFILQMKDGHEESVEKEFNENPNTDRALKEEMRKRGKEIPRERRFLVSHIELHGRDIQRFKAATEHLLPQGVALPEVIRPRAIQPQAPVDVQVTQTSTNPSTNPAKIIPNITPAMTVVREEVKEEQSIQGKTNDIDLLPEEPANVLKDTEGQEEDIAQV